MMPEDYRNWLSTQGIGAIEYAGFNPQEQLGLKNSFNNLQGSSGSGLAGVGDWFGKQSGGDLAGLAGMGLQAYSSLFGPGRDIGKEQLGLLRDQRDYNRQAMVDRKKFNQGLAQASKNVFGSGLAAQGV